MANTKSAKKAIRVSARKREFNKPQRTRAKTVVRKAEEMLEEGDVAAAKEAAIEAAKVLDQAAVKGVIHPNKAARHKSRIMKRLNELAQESTEA